MGVASVNLLQGFLGTVHFVLLQNKSFVIVEFETRRAVYFLNV